MKVAYVAHSLIASRQRLFAEELERQLQTHGGELLQVYPLDWNNHHRFGGYKIPYAQGDLMRFTFPEKAWTDLAKFKPDVVVIQQEASSACAADALRHAKLDDWPYVSFSWENVFPQLPIGLEFLTQAKATVWGNTRAYELAKRQGLRHELWDDAFILPQVGVSEERFPAKIGQEKEYDIVFVGRTDPMKGRRVLDEATLGSNWRVNMVGQTRRLEYEEMAQAYHSAWVHVTPSIDFTNRPIEQFAPYANVESLFCCTPVIATDASAFREWLEGCPTAWFVPQNDPKRLREAINDYLIGPRKYLGLKGREWAVKRFANRVVVREWIRVLERAAA